MLVPMLANCTSGRKTFTLPVEQIERNKTIHEVIVFVGNPGVGKSSLINSIIQEPVFKSGVSGGIGLTRQEQSYVHENKLYIDTPGIDDINLRQQAAVEIEKALKHGNKYKIVFVATLESGRIRPADIVAINTVCAAIKTDFEYGLIINKTTKEVIAKLFEEQGLMKFFQGQLCKQPSSILTLGFDVRMYDKEDKYFSKQSHNKEALVNFVNQLTAKDIKREDVVKLDVRDFKEKVEALEKAEEAHKKELVAMKEQLQVSEEERKLEEERHKAEQERHRADQARLKEKLVSLEEQHKKERKELEGWFGVQMQQLKEMRIRDQEEQRRREESLKQELIKQEERHRKERQEEEERHRKEMTQQEERYRSSMQQVYSASQNRGSSPSRPTGIMTATGTIIGAAAGGPVGAAVGAGAGTILENCNVM